MLSDSSGARSSAPAAWARPWRADCGGPGFDVVVYNRTRAGRGARRRRRPAPRSPPPPRGARPADVVIVSLADDAAVLAAYTGADGLLAGLRDGHGRLRHQHRRPRDDPRLAPVVAERRRHAARHPGVGQRPAGRARRADRDGRRRRGRRSTGPGRCSTRSPRDLPSRRHGAGATMKLVVNSLGARARRGAQRGARARRDGRARPDAAYDVLASGAVGAPFVQVQARGLPAPDQTPVAFSLDLVAKDQDLIHTLAKNVGAWMTQGEANRLELVAAAVAAGMGERRPQRPCGVPAVGQVAPPGASSSSIRAIVSRLVGPNHRLDRHGLDDLIGWPCYPPPPDPDLLHGCHHPSYVRQRGRCPPLKPPDSRGPAAEVDGESPAVTGRRRGPAPARACEAAAHGAGRAAPLGAPEPLSCGAAAPGGCGSARTGSSATWSCSFYLPSAPERRLPSAYADRRGSVRENRLAGSPRTRS